MQSRAFIATTLTVAFSAALSLNPVLAQPKGSLYALHTGRESGCPGLDWHVTVEPDGELAGFVAWNAMQHMARLNGTISKNGSFEMNAKEVGGAARTATVKGTASGDYIKISIEGSGTACDNLVLNVPRASGGMGGGGG